MVIINFQDITDPLERRERLKCELKIRGHSFSSIANDLKISATSVSLVAAGKHRSAGIQNKIAEILDLNVEEIWPKKNY